MQNSRPTGNSLLSSSHGPSLRPGPAIHPYLAPLVALAVTDEERAPLGVQIGLVQRERFADP
jgi:hypothetical protein